MSGMKKKSDGPSKIVKVETVICGKLVGPGAYREQHFNYVWMVLLRVTNMLPVENHY